MHKVKGSLGRLLNLHLFAKNVSAIPLNLHHRFNCPQLHCWALRCLKIIQQTIKPWSHPFSQDRIAVERVHLWPRPSALLWSYLIVRVRALETTVSSSPHFPSTTASYTTGAIVASAFRFVNAKSNMAKPHNEGKAKIAQVVQPRLRQVSVRSRIAQFPSSKNSSTAPPTLQGAPHLPRNRGSTPRFPTRRLPQPRPRRNKIWFCFHIPDSSHMASSFYLTPTHKSNRKLQSINTMNSTKDEIGSHYVNVLGLEHRYGKSMRLS